jgi:hypothetical protein
MLRDQVCNLALNNNKKKTMRDDMNQNRTLKHHLNVK